MKEIVNEFLEVQSVPVKLDEEKIKKLGFIPSEYSFDLIEMEMIFERRGFLDSQFLVYKFDDLISLPLYCNKNTVD